jgi:hypothetical protein
MFPPRELLSLPPESEIGQIHARMHDNEPNYNSKDQQGIQAVEESLVVTQVIVDSDGVLHESIDGSNEDGGAANSTGQFISRGKASFFSFVLSSTVSLMLAITKKPNVASWMPTSTSTMFLPLFSLLSVSALAIMAPRTHWTKKERSSKVTNRGVMRRAGIQRCLKD